MTLKDRLQEDMKTALKAHDKQRLGTVRLALAALKQKEVDERIVLTDEHVVAILNKMIKMRRDSIEQYTLGNRQDLADQEIFEIGVLTEYLPAALGDAEVTAAINAAIQEAGAASIADLGKVMGLLKARLQGRADLAQVSGQVKVILTR